MSASENSEKLEEGCAGEFSRLASTTDLIEAHSIPLPHFAGTEGTTPVKPGRGRPKGSKKKTSSDTTGLSAAAGDAPQRRSGKDLRSTPCVRW